jgi:ABC-type antimicrobial peptide transport system permease subunit
LFRVAFAAAVTLLLLGAVNVAGFFAARGRDRERELAVRLALGAGRTDLIRLMLSEALVLAFVGSVVGVALAPTRCAPATRKS